MKWYGWVGLIIGLIMSFGHAYIGTVDILLSLDKTHYSMDNQLAIIIVWHIVTLHLILMASGFYLFRYFTGKAATIFGCLLIIQFAFYTITVLFGSLFWLKSLWQMPMWVAFLPNTIIAGYMTVKQSKISSKTINHQ